MTFSDYNLSPSILKALGDLGFEKPTPIQEMTFKHFQEKETDLIGLAQTGTGKTAAFSIPILQSVDESNPDVQAIILSPTRELCLQISKDIESYTKYMPGVNVLAVYGGTSISTQIKKLRDGTTIVVGTPGRTLDLINRRKLKLNNINWLVFDEADEMLSMGFKDDLDAILEACPAERKTLLFSATMPNDIKRIGMNYMNDPAQLTAGTANVSANNIEHKYFMVNARDRYMALKRLADVNPDIYAIIFCRTKAGTQEVADKLGEDGYNADAIHGDLSQAQRDFVMSRFRKRQIQMLVATDVAARGIDVEDLTHVIHYQLPDENEIYIHRSGRTGRAGKKGESLSIIHSREMRKIRDIERKIKKEITLAQVPSGQAICEAQLFHLVKKVHDVEVNEKVIGGYLENVTKQLEGLDRDELIKRFISVEFNRFLDFYDNARDINVDGSSSRDRNDRSDGRSRKGDENLTKMVINHGRKSGLTPPLLINFLNELMNSKSFEIGKININDGNSTVWVENTITNDLEKAIKNSSHQGVTIWKDKDQTPEESFRGGRGGDRRGGGGHRKGGGRGGDRRSGGGGRGGDRRSGGGGRDRGGSGRSGGGSSRRKR